jgi:uncharacterized membrane protein
MPKFEFRHRLGYFLLAAFAFMIGLYPLRFIGLPVENGLLGDKPQHLLNTLFYVPAFYLHISLGGIALLAGFTQFFPQLRRKQPRLHRSLGKLYVLAVMISGLSGLLIAFFAKGGYISALGFGSLAVLWIYTTIKAYMAIRKHELPSHQRWMIRSYALCFAAVTLRIYLPLTVMVAGMEFITAYRMIAWLCWVPNLIAAEYLIIGSYRFVLQKGKGRSAS